MEKGGGRGIMNIEKYPEEIFLDIFSRLPSRSLCIIRCVCKQWDKLSKDPWLHSMRLARARAIERETSFLIIRSDTDDILRSSAELFAQHFTSRERLLNFSELGGDILHSCDDLLCTVKRLQTFTLGVIVSNPFTREHLTLPPFAEPPSWPLCSFGLGFDSSIEKYKVVCVFYRDVDSPNKRCRLGAQVCTIGTSSSSSSSWRDIISQPTAPLCHCRKSVYASGARHWMVDYRLRCSNDLDPMVISFDFTKEEFKTIPCQEFFSVSKYSEFGLVDLRGCLGMANYSLDQQIEIWKLKDYERNLWVREYKIDWLVREYIGTVGIRLHVLQSVEMVGLMGEDDIVFLRITYDPDDDDDYDRPDEDALLAYNVETSTWRKLYSFTDVDQRGLPDNVYLLHGGISGSLS